MTIMSKRPAPPLVKLAAEHDVPRNRVFAWIAAEARSGGARAASKRHPGPLAHPIAPARHQPDRMLVAAIKAF
jgi:hypothetical protein